MVINLFSKFTVDQVKTSLPPSVHPDNFQIMAVGNSTSLDVSDCPIC